MFKRELWRIGNQASERSERVRFVIQNNECVNTVQSTFHVVLCLLYTYWDWTPLLKLWQALFKQIWSNNNHCRKESSFVKSERAQIKSKTYKIKLAYLSSKLFSRGLTPQFEFFSTSFLFQWYNFRFEYQEKRNETKRNRVNQPWMKTSTCRTAHTWKNTIRGSWLDVSLFSHVGKAIRDIWLVHIGLRTEIYSAAFLCVNLSV